jgi:hypothetical protein
MQGSTSQFETKCSSILGLTIKVSGASRTTVDPADPESTEFSRHPDLAARIHSNAMSLLRGCPDDGRLAFVAGYSPQVYARTLSCSTFACPSMIDGAPTFLGYLHVKARTPGR